MPLSKVKNKARMRKLRRFNVKSVMSSADVRAARRAGINPEDIGSEFGKVSANVYYALLRDRDAIKAHLSWHHEAMKYLDVSTVIERLQAEVGQLQSRVTQLEAGLVLHEAQESYQPMGREIADEA